MEKFKLTTVLHKTRDNGSIAIKDIVNETLEFNRKLGKDGEDIRIKNSDGAKVIDITPFPGIEFLRIEAVWDETDSTNGIIAGNPAPFEIEFNNESVWRKQTRLTLENPNGITSLKVRNPDNVNDKFIKIKIILSATGVN